MHAVRVAGEPLDALIEALQHIEMRSTGDGMATMSMRLEPRLGDPFVRALMRVQAELLRDDADHLGEDHWEARTHEQRAHDAFVALALRVAAAADGRDDGLSS